MSSIHDPTPRAPDRRRRRLSVALLGATGFAVAGLAYGQTGGSAYDPAQLPETRGTLKQYTLTPRGDVDGLILQDGTEVKVPPHLSAQVVFAVRPGDPVSVRGLKARALPLIAASVVRNETTGATVMDEGGPRADRDRTESLVTGRVERTLHGPRGEANGVLFENGMTVRMPPPEAERWASLIEAGKSLSVRGIVTRTLLGQVMEARAVGATPDGLSYLSALRGPKGWDDKPPKRPKEAREDRGPRREVAFDPPPRGPADGPPLPRDGAPPPPPNGAPLPPRP